MPHVIEPALGVNRSMLTFLVDAYDEEVVGERERTVLRLHPQLAPVKAAVLPLIGKDTAMVEKARGLYEELRRHFSVEYDDSGAIGRRYRRQDEIGTPYGLTIDEQTLEDDTVTVRDRDSLEQERLPIGGVAREGRRAARRRLALAEDRPSAPRARAAARRARSRTSRTGRAHPRCAGSNGAPRYGPSSTVKRTSSTPCRGRGARRARRRRRGRRARVGRIDRAGVADLALRPARRGRRSVPRASISPSISLPGRPVAQYDSSEMNRCTASRSIESVSSSSS